MTAAPAGRRGGGVTALLLLVMLAWGANISAVKALTGAMDVAWVGAVRMALAALVLTGWLWWRDRALPRLRPREWAVLAAISGLTVYANQLLFVQGMRHASASNASLVMALMPLLALLAGALLLRERIAPRALVGVALGFAGVVVVVLRAPGAQLGRPGVGELVILIGLVAFITGGLLVQRAVRALDVLVVTWGVYVCGTPMLWLHAAVAGGWQGMLQAFDSRWVWWCALYSGAIGTALSNLGWYHAIGRIGQSRASPYLYWVAVFGVLVSMFALNERVGWWHALGLALVVAGVRLGAAAPARAR